jgi:hypothetical protein
MVWAKMATRRGFWLLLILAFWLIHILGLGEGGRVRIVGRRAVRGGAWGGAGECAGEVILKDESMMVHIQLAPRIQLPLIPKSCTVASNHLNQLQIRTPAAFPFQFQILVQFIGAPICRFNRRLYPRMKQTKIRVSSPTWKLTSCTLTRLLRRK